MTPHTHLTAVPLLTNVLAVVAVLGTAHMLALSFPNGRVSRAIIGLGI